MKKICSGTIVFARIIIMISDTKRPVTAAYQLKIEAIRISQLIKYNQLSRLKFLGFYLI